MHSDTIIEKIPNCFYRISAKALILDKDKRFLLVKEANGMWELPGGGLDFGENPQDGIRREILEEMGLNVTFVAQCPSYFLTARHTKTGTYMANVLYETKVEHLNFISSAECVAIQFFTQAEAMQEENLFSKCFRVCEDVSKGVSINYLSYNPYTVSNTTYMTLHLICGLPGSGKTTLAKKIEAELHAIRLSPDEWIKQIWPGNIAETEGNRYRDQIEQLQWSIGKRVLQAGVDIVIEWGTWGKAERIRLRDEARMIGSKVKLYYMDIDKSTLQERIIARNANLGAYDFYMAEATLSDDLDTYIQQFQIPEKDELEQYDSVETYIGDY